VVGELGFGTGLNVLALLQLWARTRPSPEARLHVFSVEGFPLAPDDAARALAAWPELAALAAPLLAAWPKGRRGRRRVEWPDLGAVLDLAVDDVEPALQGWSGRADAWFLDGFAPAKNPQMWTDAVLAAVAARSAPGARAATFTVAGAVRRGLQAQGFRVEKRPGFGSKRERLEAVAPGVAAPRDAAAPSVVVVGAGIAGAALARAFDRLGAAVTVIDAEGPGAGASGNAAALVTPRLDAGGGTGAHLHAEAFARAVALYDAETPQAVIARGALQLARTPRDPARFAAVAAQDVFDPGAVVPVTPASAAARLGEAGAPDALDVADAPVVEPAAVLAAWLPDVRRAAVVSLRRESGDWVLSDAEGSEIARPPVVVLANGLAAATLAPGLALRPVRGQATTADIAFDGEAAAWGAYAVPTRAGVLFGASHGPGDADGAVRAHERGDNLARLAQARPALAARIAALPADALADRAGVRAATADHHPVAGALEAEGLFVLAGLGGRGFTLAPLLAEHVAALACGAPSPLADDLARLVDPLRPLLRRGPEPPP
jgi:tRNA 5-methylaminomethyl-2-thiouridine biosynthesis bifunctional protein